MLLDDSSIGRGEYSSNRALLWRRGIMQTERLGVSMGSGMALDPQHAWDPSD